MTGTLTIQSGLKVVNDNLTHDDALESGDVVQTVQGLMCETISTSVSEADFDISSMTAPGWARLEHLDETGSNYIYIGIDNTGIQALIELRPGDPPAVLPIKADVTAIRHQASAGTPKLHITIHER